MICSLYCVCESKKEAESIVRKLIDEKLIACGNCFPVNSFFFWDNKLQNTEEFAFLAKTLTSLSTVLKERISQLHSYEVPCIVFYPIIDSNDKYRDWIIENVRKK